MSADAEVVAAWERIERAIDAIEPSLLAVLAAPCSAETLAWLEGKLTVPVPEGLAASLLRHDGEILEEGILAPFPLLGCAEIADEWKAWTGMQADGTFEGFDENIEPDPAIKGDRWYRDGWIPFAGGDGDNLCIDLDPGPGGTAGQVVVMDHEVGPNTVLAASFPAWLALWADDLEAGVFEHVEDGLAWRDGRTSRAFR